MAKITNKKRVAVWGTFDLLHEGHKQFLRKVSEIGSLYVIVLPDSKVTLNKGRFPIHSENERKSNLQKLPYVKDVYIDCIDDGLESIKKIDPEFFCLGYDQMTLWENKLSKLFSEMHLGITIKRMGIYANGIHSKHIRGKIDSLRSPKHKDRFSAHS